ncbi:hypothetical protein CASFOL_018106 [Castilleja foliolosa]|uniref:Uncharacterized protein n=1 Tax=Castilleja foliolosa TaxID=1961234 RepID=A0ABD3D874_9LAMI
MTRKRRKHENQSFGKKEKDLKNALPAEKEELKKQMKKAKDPKAVNELKGRVAFICSDFGLAKFFSDTNTHVSTRVMGTFGASDKFQREKRKTINGDDLLWAMATLGFEDYLDPLTAYLARYREELLKGDTEGLLQLPSDKALLSDPSFRPLVEKYAADEDAFFADYAEAHLKLSELGFAEA